MAVLITLHRRTQPTKPADVLLEDPLHLVSGTRGSFGLGKWNENKQLCKHESFTVLSSSLIRLTTKLSGGKNRQHNKHANMRVFSFYDTTFCQIFFVCFTTSRNSCCFLLLFCTASCEGFKACFESFLELISADTII